MTLRINPCARNSASFRVAQEERRRCSSGDRAGFEKAIAAYRAATDTLVAKAETGDLAAVQEAMKGVGKPCGGCHDSFRKDDD